MPKKYHGESPGRGALDSLEKALDKAWQDAKGDGKENKKLRVDEWYVRGQNPINWSSVVLVDDDA
jgi:hypothetical protein